MVSDNASAGAFYLGSIARRPDGIGERVTFEFAGLGSIDVVGH